MHGTNLHVKDLAVLGMLSKQSGGPGLNIVAGLRVTRQATALKVARPGVSGGTQIAFPMEFARTSTFVPSRIFQTRWHCNVGFCTIVPQQSMSFYLICFPSNGFRQLLWFCRTLIIREEFGLCSTLAWNRHVWNLVRKNTVPLSAALCHLEQTNFSHCLLNECLAYY